MGLAMEVQAVRKVYATGRIAVEAIRRVSFAVREGEMVAIMGPSGSGKSTLLNLLGCLDTPTAGTYFLAGEDVSQKADDDLAAVRNRHIGFVFQSYNLLPQLTALENVELPLVYRGVPLGERRRLAEEALRQVGIAHLLRHKPLEMSGGEQQRVGIARALAMDPKVILADEPTGNLDSRSGLEVLKLFQDLHRQGRTLVIVTHDPNVSRHCERILRLKDGEIVDDAAVPPDQRLEAEAELREGGEG